MIEIQQTFSPKLKSRILKKNSIQQFPSLSLPVAPSVIYFWFYCCLLSEIFCPVARALWNYHDYVCDKVFPANIGQNSFYWSWKKQKPQKQPGEGGVEP